MGVEVILKKKVYNPSLDSGPGVVVFDKSARKIWVGGECYSSEVMDISYNTTTKVLLITKFDGTAITLNFSTFETTGNKVTTLSAASTDTQYPSAKCVYDSIRKKPVTVWEATTTAQGILAREADISATPNWHLTDLDMTPFKYVEIYIKAGGSANVSYTPSIVIEVDLSDMNKSTFGHFLGSAVVQAPNDRNRLLAVSVAVSEDKTKVVFSRCTSLYGTAATDANNNGRIMYKIVGYYD